MRKTLWVAVAVSLCLVPSVAADDPPPEEPDGTNDACVATASDPTPYVILDAEDCITLVENHVQFVRDQFGI